MERNGQKYQESRYILKKNIGRDCEGEREETGSNEKQKKGEGEMNLQLDDDKK